MAEDTPVVGAMDALFTDTDAPKPEATKEAVVQPTAPPPAEAKTEGQPRQPDGKFASTTPTTAAPLDPAPASPTPSVEDPEKQPITKAEFKGMLEERDKRHKAEARASAAERRIQEYEQQQSQIPSDTDPDVARRISNARADALFSTSERWAKKEHGEEVVSSAMDWAMQRSQQSPAFAAEYLRQEHPIEWAVKQQKRDVILTEIGDDPDAFIRKRMAELSAETPALPSQAVQPPAATPQPAAPKPPPPKPSLVSAQSAGGMQTVPAVAPFDAVFPK